MLFGEIFVVAEVVAQVATAEVLHRKIKMLPILKGVNSVDNKRVGHLIEKQLFVDD